MKVIVIGGSGTIGKKVVSRLIEKHQVLVAGRTSGEIRVDISDADSIESMYNTVANVDAVVCIAGEATWAPFESMSEEDFYVGLRSKLMGQVNLVRLGSSHLNAGG